MYRWSAATAASRDSQLRFHRHNPVEGQPTGEMATAARSAGTSSWLYSRWKLHARCLRADRGAVVQQRTYIFERCRARLRLRLVALKPSLSISRQDTACYCSWLSSWLHHLLCAFCYPQYVAAPPDPGRLGTGPGANFFRLSCCSTTEPIAAQRCRRSKCRAGCPAGWPGGNILLLFSSGTGPASAMLSSLYLFCASR